MNKVISHHGIRGQRWGVRRFQNEDGSLTPKGAARLDKKDAKWVAKQGEKIKQKAKSEIQGDLNEYVKNELNAQFTSNGKLTAKTVLNYNRKMASLMNEHIGNVPTPSGKVLRFVAKRGELGVFSAYADAGYNLTNLKSGVFTSGKVGYKNENLMRTGG